MMPLYRAAALDTIRMALGEDIGQGDITTLSVVSPQMLARGLFVSKDTGVLAGLDIVQWVFEELSGEISLTRNMDDGATMKPGDLVAEAIGPARELLMGERVALNFLQRLSGIATLTRLFVDQVSHTKAVIVDTRKTTPGLRNIEKYAVRAGGGSNHRAGLFDAVLIKDNHIVAAGGVTAAVERARLSVPHTAKIEVECETRLQVLEALECHADIIMLDNMGLEMMRDMVGLIAGRATVEASGNMEVSRVAEVAETGVDVISAGRLTRGATSLDISLDLELL